MHRRGFARSKRFRGDLGVALTEYALIFSLLAVGTLAATQYLDREASKETEQQALCVSERPPPPSCQIPSAATTTTETVGPPPTTDPPVTGPTIPPPLPGSVTDGPGDLVSGTNPGPWTVTFAGTVLDSGGMGVEGVTIRFQVFLSDGTTTISVGPTSCVTDATGTCTATYTQDPEAAATSIEAEIIEVIGVDPEPTLTGSRIPVTLP